MSNIFISYRRADSIAETRSIHTYLASELGRDMVFMDFEGIEGGDHFPERLNQAVNQCQVLLVVIGKDWLQIKDDSSRKRRLGGV